MVGGGLRGAPSAVRSREEGASAAAINDDGARETPAGEGPYKSARGGRGRAATTTAAGARGGTIHFYTRARLSIDPITPPVSVTKSIFSPTICPAHVCGQQQCPYSIPSRRFGPVRGGGTRKVGWEQGGRQNGRRSALDENRFLFRRPKSDDKNNNGPSKHDHAA